MESNYAGNMSIGNYRGTFDPTSSAHVVLYTIFTHNEYKKAIRLFSNRFYLALFYHLSSLSRL
ncbi:hypothetical protein HMPREF9192_1844 [Streptococcus vestibularis F0396]|uniref:Uncharacterized protein n=1 Tax=Streptococcus vestibularis F0396 TaxID=904306 RepID=E3CPM5_STRVE|nr:hypothetical protein HMPREF9192_1844 [Streptococcus vestibularis F0396]